jgi:hypothetical protein
MTATEDRELRRVLHDTLQSLPPSPAPVEAIIRRSRRIRLLRAGAAAGTLALAGLIAVTSLALRSGQPPTAPPLTASATAAGPDGGFAHGTADGHPWRLAVQNIADPGYRCVPAIVLNGTDADPVYPHPLGGAVTALGPAVPGIGFSFIQLPTKVSGIVVDNIQKIPAVTVAACGYRYHIAGFAYPLTTVLRIAFDQTVPGMQPVLTAPGVSTQAKGFASAKFAGQWANTAGAPGASASQILGSGTLRDGLSWSITLLFGTDGDCYEFTPSPFGRGPQGGICGPASTPNGPETIVPLPVGDPYATGYAIQVSPQTAHLRAILSNGSAIMVTPRVVDGRKYVAFTVSWPLYLFRLVWLDAKGVIIATTTDVPRSATTAYVQFRP